MANEGLNKILALSPHIEMVVRRAYRNKILSRFLNKRKKSIERPKVVFDDIIYELKRQGIKNGDILVVHSAYSPLKSSGLSPKDIVQALKSIVGDKGTLAMPVIRKYPESPKEDELLTAPIEDILFKYNVQKSKVWTGIIPKTLMNEPNSITSQFPLNTLTAWGPHAKDMMKNNLEGDLPTPNGINSSWNYCAENNAWVVSIGPDLTHSLTMIHTAEDTQKYKWPVKNWYREKKFIITDGDMSMKKVVLERHPKWGMLHFGERTLAKELEINNIMNSVKIHGVLIESLKSKNLMDFLNSKNKKGYPYFWLGKDFEK